MNDRLTVEHGHGRGATAFESSRTPPEDQPHQRARGERDEDVLRDLFSEERVEATQGSPLLRRANHFDEDLFER